MERYQDVMLAPEERAEDLLKRMSPEEKMAQVNCVFLAKDNIEALKKTCPYGIGEISTLEMRQADSLEEAVEMQRAAQRAIMENSRFGIPAIFHMEGLCGAFLPEAVSFPSGIARAASWDYELEEQLGEIVGRQERVVGITHTLAPVLDISRDSRMGRQGETYGEDPTLAARMGTAFTRGIQKEETDGRRSEAVAKHFMGFHNSEGGIHGAASNTPRRLLTEIHGKPFQAAIREAGLRGVMPCYCSLDGEPASASESLLTEILRDEMGFDGLAVSDYGAVGNVHQVQKAYESVTEAGLRCMEAGMDVEMPNCTGYNEELLDWFKNGLADMEVLDRAVKRVLTAKFRMGLFEHPYAAAGEELRQKFHRDEDREAILQSAKESLVLIKNEGVLPLDGKRKRIALIGPHADNPRSFFGGYTHISMVEAICAVRNSLAGVETADTDGRKKNAEILMVLGTNIQSDETEEFDAILRKIKPECRSLLAVLREKLPETEVIYAHGYPIAGEDESGFEEALEAARQADICILTLGGKHGSCSVATMGEGVDATDIGLPICQERFIQKVAGLGIPVIGIHFNGRPISSDVADENLAAILEAWNPSEAGAEAIVQVLMGEYNPSGRLPVSVAYNAGQVPVYYNHPNGSSWHQGDSIGFTDYVDMPHTPRYYFGHGLLYTTFTYQNLKIDKDGEDVRVSCWIQNTGKRAGTEIVQLYVRDRYARMVRPVMELAGFVRVTMDPGESREVTFFLKESQLAFLDGKNQWLVEAGEIDVMIGTSSADIRLEGSFRINQTRWIKGRDRAFWAEAVIRQE